MTPKEEVEQLMNDGVPFAEKMLSEHGEFFPFGRALTPDGQVQLVSATDGSNKPRSQVLIDYLLQAFRDGAKAGTHRAVALFFDVRVLDPTTGRKVDAVQVGLEHRDGYCADVFFPYTLAKRSVHFGPIFAQERHGRVYDSGQDDGARPNQR